MAGRWKGGDCQRQAASQPMMRLIHKTPAPETHRVFIRLGAVAWVCATERKRRLAGHDGGSQTSPSDVTNHSLTLVGGNAGEGSCPGNTVTDPGGAGFQLPTLLSLVNPLCVLSCLSCVVSVLTTPWRPHGGQQCDDNGSKETCHGLSCRGQEVRGLISRGAAGVAPRRV